MDPTGKAYEYKGKTYKVLKPVHAKIPESFYRKVMGMLSQSSQMEVVESIQEKGVKTKGWIASVLYISLEGDGMTYVRESKDFFNKFKHVGDA